jgi:hypothetical protein
VCTIGCRKRVLARGNCSLFGLSGCVYGVIVRDRPAESAFRRRLILTCPVSGSFLKPICMLWGDLWWGDTGDGSALSGVSEPCKSPVWARAGARSDSAGAWPL